MPLRASSAVLLALLPLAGCQDRPSIGPAAPFTTALADDTLIEDVEDEPQPAEDFQERLPFPGRVNPFDSPLKADPTVESSKTHEVRFQGRIVSDRPRAVLLVDESAVVLGVQESARGLTVLEISEHEVRYQRGGREFRVRFAGD